MSSVPAPRPHLFTVEDFHRLGQSIPPDARVELIEGVVYDMPPLGSEHASTVETLRDLLTTSCVGRYQLWSQNPLRLDGYTELYPDLAVLKLRQDRYFHTIPVVADALLVIEVSHTTLKYDRETKLPLYQRAGIPEIWIVDTQGRVVTVSTRSGDGYISRCHQYRQGRVQSSQVPGLEIDLEELFPED